MSKPRYFPHLAGSLVLASAAALGLLHKWEPDPRDPGLVYADNLAGGLPTVCSGLTRHVTSTPIIVGERWAPEKCRAEESAALEKVQGRLARCFTTLPPQSVFDAATSHAWNFGSPSTCGSAAMTAWNRKQWELGCKRIAHSDSGRPVWSYVKTGRMLPNGKPEYELIQGLVNRRADEVRVCMGDLRAAA